MKAIIQIVKSAQVKTQEKIIGSIDEGLLIYIGFSQSDKEEILKKLAHKIVNLRVFDNEDGKIDKNILDLKNKKILLVSQFTLYADLSSRRPGFSKAMKADKASTLYKQLVNILSDLTDGRIETGQFQAHMEVESVNDGPFTLILEV